MNTTWQAATREVCFIVCEVCRRRLEVEIDGSGHSADQLATLYARHWNTKHSSLFKGEELMKMFPAYRRLIGLRIHVERLDLDLPLDLGDIISTSQLRFRASRLSERSGLSIESAERLIVRRVSALVLSSAEKYVCRLCGRYITPRVARRSGYGRECLEVHAKD